MNSNNNNRKTTRKKKEKKEKHAENLEMSKTPTKIVQKKKKPWNTEIQRLEKKKMFKTLSSDTKKHKVSRNKNMFGSICKKNPNQNLAVISSHINTGYWGVFTNELSRKDKKKEKKIQSQESDKYDVLEK